MEAHEVRDITVDRQNGIEIDFADGRHCSYGLEELRVSCPCASCRSAREADRAPWPTANSPMPLAITDASLVGAWGLSITWNDGHSTGIYPWESLRRWCEHGRAAFPPDSGFGGAGSSSVS